jgi:Icc-related predicted phosphoesterase
VSATLGGALACFFVSDLHGSAHRYEALFQTIALERPAAVFLGGDLLPHALDRSQASPAADGGPQQGFVASVLLGGFARLRHALAGRYPRVFVIPGNDDARCDEPVFLEGQRRNLWEYAHQRRAQLGPHAVFGYGCVPPTPFQLKDWERYDVSRYVPPGCVSPEEGWHTVEVEEHELRTATIREDLERLVGCEDLGSAILLIHTPPYETCLDRAALDGQSVDHVPLDLHVGSIAVLRLIQERQPLLTLHGHVHESARLTGAWRQRIGPTWCLGAAHDSPQLALVRFDPADPGGATRALL